MKNLFVTVGRNVSVETKYRMTCGGLVFLANQNPPCVIASQTEYMILYCST